MVQANHSAAQVKAHLLGIGINVFTSPVTSARLDFEYASLPEELIRASVHYYNTSDDIGALIKALKLMEPQAPSTI